MGVIIFVYTVSQLIAGNVYGYGIPFFILFNLLAISFWTAKDILKIDLTNKRIGEGFKVFCLKRLNWIKYSDIEKIYINSVNTAGQDQYSLPWSVTVRDKVYKAFLKTTDGHKLLLTVARDKGLMLKRLNQFNETLRTQIFDTSN